MTGIIEYEDPNQPGHIKSTPFRSETERVRKMQMLQDRYPDAELHIREEGEGGQEGNPPVRRPQVSSVGPADTLIGVLKLVSIIGPLLYLLAIGIGLAQMELSRNQWLILALPHVGWALMLGLMGFVFAAVLNLLQRIEARIAEGARS
ncbi:hypothetical protein [Thioalkalivibrio sp. ALMg13-2]|uniref:hypothetical protein n=1 Tax=Thioalkalivibrio sp. ALMg13-2 TaxID=1158167 RepID=UPI0003773A04|nr:hypothetical protein [Thioalkalivibrio sp. ALMg13-2]